jgi:hypothetical protein
LISDDLEFDFSLEDLGDQPSYLWSEDGARGYLLDVAESVGRFYEFYINSRHISNRLDYIFIKMNWARRASGTNRFICYDEGDPATFHLHPLYIAFSAISTFLDSIFEIATKHAIGIPNEHYFGMYKSTGLISRAFMCGIYSIDSMEYALAVHHFKEVLCETNAILSIFDTVLSSCKNDTHSHTANFLIDLKVATFDIRELAWQAVSFCNSLTK